MLQHVMAMTSKHSMTITSSECGDCDPSWRTLLLIMLFNLRDLMGAPFGSLTLQADHPHLCMQVPSSWQRWIWLHCCQTRPWRHLPTSCRAGAVAVSAVTRCVPPALCESSPHRHRSILHLLGDAGSWSFQVFSWAKHILDCTAWFLALSLKSSANSRWCTVNFVEIC